MGVEMRFTKWGGKRHWHFVLEPLGTDRHGWWLCGRTGIQLRRGYEEPVLQPHDFVVLVPAEGDWIASFNAAADPLIYVDVTSRPVCRPDAIEAVDLDLDVIRRRDGAVQVLDEDEFAEHQVKYGYPAELIARARATTDDLVARITAGDEPFGRAADTWLAKLTAA
jgi:uncharacterized protein